MEGSKEVARLSCQSTAKMGSLCVALLFLASLAASEDPPCNVTLSVDISDGDGDASGSIAKDGAVYGPGDYFEHEGRTMGCVCKVRGCIRKCCPTGEYMTGEKRCETTERNFTEDLAKLTAADVNSYAIIVVPCNGKSFVIEPDEEEFSFTEEGLLKWGEDLDDSYCADYVKATDQVRVIVCDVEEESEENTHNSIGIVRQLE